MHRFWFALGIAVVVALGAPTAVCARPYVPVPTRFDRRVDALTARTLLTAPVQALVDPARQRAARTITDLREGMFLVWASAQIYAFFWLWRSGNAARLRDTIRRRTRSRITLRATFGAALGLTAPLAGLPFAFVSYRIGFNVGLTEEIIGTWLVHYALGMITDAAIGAVLVVVALELVDRTRLWYLAFIVFLYVGIISVAAIDPVVLSPIVTASQTLHAAADAPVEVVRASMRTRMLTARTAGIGPFTRILLGDVLVGMATPPEVAFVIAHENAHVRHADVLKLALIATTLLIFVTAFAVLIGDRIMFRRDEDAVSRLALVGALVGTLALVAYPLYSAYSRGIEYRADEDARHALPNPTGAVRFLVRRADDDMVPLCGRRSTRWYFDSHPALGARIAAMRGTTDPCPR